MRAAGSMRGLHRAADAQRRLDALGEAGDGRLLEQPAQRQLDPQRLLHPRDQPGGQQRMAAEIEEVVVHPDRRWPKSSLQIPASASSA